MRELKCRRRNGKNINPKVAVSNSDFGVLIFFSSFAVTNSDLSKPLVWMYGLLFWEISFHGAFLGNKLFICLIFFKFSLRESGNEGNGIYILIYIFDIKKKSLGSGIFLKCGSGPVKFKRIRRIYIFKIQIRENGYEFTDPGRVQYPLSYLLVSL